MSATLLVGDLKSFGFTIALVIIALCCAIYLWKRA